MADYSAVELAALLLNAGLAGDVLTPGEVLEGMSAPEAVGVINAMAVLAAVGLRRLSADDLQDWRLRISGVLVAPPHTTSDASDVG